MFGRLTSIRRGIPPGVRRMSAPGRVAGLLLGLMGLIWLGPFQLHPPIGWVDPMLYVYWFIDPAGNFIHRGGDYHGARLPFVALGALLYRSFDMVTAQALLVSTFQLLALGAIWALSGAVLRSFPARAAVTAMVGLNPVWLAAITRGYVDGPAIALGLAALALVMRRKGPVALGAAGVLLGLAFFIHPFGGGVAGLAVGAALLGLGTSPATLAIRLAWLALGGLVTLLLSGAVATQLGLPFFFLGMGISRMQTALAWVGPTPFNLSASVWLPAAVRAVLFPLALLLALRSSWQARGTASPERALAWAALAGITVLLATLPLWAGFVVQFAFYASYVWLALLPGLLLLAREAEAAADRGRAAVAWASGLTALALLVALALPLDTRAEGWLNGIAWALAGGALLAACLLPARQARLRFAAAALALGVAGAASRDTATALRLPGGPNNAAQHAGLAGMHSFLAETGGLGGAYVVWVGRDQFNARRDLRPGETYPLRWRDLTFNLNALDSLAASLGWSSASLGFAMPTLAPGDAARALLGAGALPLPLILLCADAPDCATARDALLETGLQAELGPWKALAGSGMQQATVMRAVLRARIDGPDPSPAQVEAILARREMAEGGAGGQPKPRVERLACEALGGDQRLCRVMYRNSEGRSLARILRFQPVGPLLASTDVGPAGPAVGILGSASLAPLCRSEVQRAAMWLDRPNSLARSSDAVASFGALVAAADSGTAEHCFEALAAFSRAFDLDFRPGRMPSGVVSCEGDLQGARSLAAALQGPFAQRAVSLELAIAEAARLRGDEAACLQASARLRAEWFSLFGLPIAAGPPITPAQRLNSALGEAALQAICRSETQRAAAWFDRPDLARRSAEAETALRALIQASQNGPTTLCLERLLALDRHLDLVWRPGHMPLGPARCEGDLVAARQLAEVVRGPLADPRLAGRLSAAEAALRRGDHSVCLQAASGLRTDWREHLNLAP